MHRKKDTQIKTLVGYTTVGVCFCDCYATFKRVTTTNLQHNITTYTYNSLHTTSWLKRNQHNRVEMCKGGRGGGGKEWNTVVCVLLYGIASFSTVIFSPQCVLYWIATREMTATNKKQKKKMISEHELVYKSKGLGVLRENFTSGRQQGGVLSSGGLEGPFVFFHHGWKHTHATHDILKLRQR